MPQMGSVRPAMRSKISGHHLPNGNISRDELSVFESESFDADSYVQAKCQSMSEKGIRKLCAELMELKKESAEEMRKSVYANYSAFIQTSREISDLETELVSMRNLLTTQATLVHKLAEIQLPQIATENGGTTPHENGHLEEDQTPGPEARAESLLDTIDIHIAERRTEEAITALHQCESIIASLHPAPRKRLELSFTDRRIRLAEVLTHLAKQQSVYGPELRSVVSALNRLGDGLQAHTLLLDAHHQRLAQEMNALRPSGTSSYGGAYTAGLCQLVFSRIAQAARDSGSVFGDRPSYASELVLWARNETEAFVSLVKRHVLSASAASGGLRAAAECVQIALGHCSLLEDHGLALCPVLTRLVKPSVEQALDANLRRIEESVSVFAAADDWSLAQPPPRSSSGGRGSLLFPPDLRLSASAFRFITMVQDFIDDVTPLTSMQLTSTTVDGVARLFDSYIHLLMRAMPAAVDEEDLPEITDTLSIRVAESDLAKVSLLANAAALADELLPRAIVRILPLNDVRRRAGDHSKLSASGTRSEHRDFRRRTQQAVDKLRNRFCQKYAVELIYGGDEGDLPLLSAESYLRLDGDGDYSWQEEPMPSPVFQALFEKFKSIAGAGAELMPGRERFVTILLIRLVESVVLIFSDHPEFWEDIEEHLGPNGLQQMILDMHFTIQMTSQVNHSSLRRLHQFTDEIISRAIEAYAASGEDPNSFLPQENWFMAMAQEAIDKLSAGWNKDPNSPAASLSAHSGSSFKSHSSP